MEAANFPESNVVLGPPDGISETACSSLNIWRGVVPVEGNPIGGVVCISCWRVSAEELAEIQRTGRVWLTIWGITMPPASVQGTSPFQAGGGA